MKKYIKKKNLVIQKSGKKTIIFDSLTSEMSVLNEIAALILEKTTAGWNTGKTCDFIVKNYRVKKETAERDIEKIIAGLLKAGIIKKR